MLRLDTDLQRTYKPHPWFLIKTWPTRKLKDRANDVGHVPYMFRCIIKSGNPMDILDRTSKCEYSVIIEPLLDGTYKLSHKTVFLVSGDEVDFVVIQQSLSEKLPYQWIANASIGNHELRINTWLSPEGGIKRPVVEVGVVPSDPKPTPVEVAAKNHESILLINSCILVLGLIGVAIWYFW